MNDRFLTGLPLHRRAFLTLGLGGLGAAIAGGGGVAYFLQRVNAVQRFPALSLERIRQGATNPLFDAHPALAQQIPWRPLGVFPTPVEELRLPDGRAGVRLFVKRDDLASTLYGGNKVRKLEHFLAEAGLASRKTLITLGGIGSNHGLATALHGAAHGFAVDLALYDQPTTPHVRTNLGGFLAAGARLHYAGSVPSAFVEARRLYGRRSREGGDPYFIMVGGSSRLGCVGHVTAALELRRQIAEGLLPEPDRVFVSLGTCGTAAGLIVGLKLAGLRTRVTAVRVADPFPANAFVLRHLAQDLADYLHREDPTIPVLRIDSSDFDVVTRHLGGGYGFPTAEAEAALRWAAPRLVLETTYTGKALAACLDHVRGAARPETILFWNTFSSTPVLAPASWSELPPPLRRFASG